MKKNDYKICFVCTGNACRSPFAECVTKVFLNKEGLNHIEVYSCRTLDWGENPRDEGMCRVAQQMGYELTGVTTTMTRDLLEKADLIIVFETKHRNEITRVLDYNQWNKISLFNQLAFGENKDMEDPHMQSESTYKRIATQIEKGCEQLVLHMKMEIL
jgi:protein-tyrosine phosphatase